MKAQIRAIHPRVALLVALLALAVVACISLAVLNTSRTLRRLENVELAAVELARQFRSEVDGLHSVLLRIGTAGAAGDRAAIRPGRPKLDEWVRARLARGGQRRRTTDFAAIGGDPAVLFPSTR